MSSTRQYELVVFGATGFTGKLTAEYVAKNLPADLKWAIAGRSADKLAGVVKELQQLNKDRPAPGIEVCGLDKDQLDALAKKTTLLITTVGPYMKYGTPVVEACANNGTHYLDCTGETPWYKEMVEKFHDTAVKNNAIIMPEVGVDSIPSDMTAYTLAKLMRSEHSLPTKEIVATYAELNATPSGGTLSTMLSMFDHYTLSQVAQSAQSHAISPVKPQKSGLPRMYPDWLGSLFGVRHDPQLGWLTDGIMARPNMAIAHRSWGLLSADPATSYGPRFRYVEFASARSFLTGLLWHAAVNVGMLFLLLPPVRRVLQRLATAPGAGPSAEAAKKERMVLRAVAYPDSVEGGNHLAAAKRATSELVYRGGMYDFTALCLAETAMCIIRPRDKSRSEVHRRGGGVLTTALLGDELIDRLKAAGMEFEAKTIG